MYLRFAVTEICGDSGQELGIFQISFRLREEGRLADWEERQLLEARDWFKRHLPVPTCYKHGEVRAVCWFRPEAIKLVNLMWEMVWVLKEMVSTR